MGHIFNRTTAAVDDASYQDQACLGFLCWRPNADSDFKFKTHSRIRLKYKPTLREDMDRLQGKGEIPSNRYLSNLSLDLATQYIQDVFDAVPGVAKRLDIFEFEFPLGDYDKYLKLLGMHSLLRYVDESWKYVEAYFDMRQRGIPRDVALLGCCCDHDDYLPVSWGGHNFLGSWTNLLTLKNFNLMDGYFNKTNLASSIELQKNHWVLHQKPFFGKHHFYPATFKMTKEIYDAFIEDTSIIERQRLISGAQGKVYSAIV
jgi:hypothetical protein